MNCESCQHDVPDEMGWLVTVEVNHPGGRTERVHHQRCSSCVGLFVAQAHRIIGVAVVLSSSWRYPSREVINLVGDSAMEKLNRRGH